MIKLVTAADPGEFVDVPISWIVRATKKDRWR
jgi:hypothetical protein